MKTALFVGASRGLGAGLVGEHLARGWTVTATVRRRSPELAALSSTHPGRLTVIEGVDINSQPQVADLAARLAGQTFDLVFLNAGIMAGRGQALRDVPDADVVSIFATNAISPIRAFEGTGVPDDLLLHGMAAWSSMFGAVSFEVFGHLTNVVDDDPAIRRGYFELLMADIAQGLGLDGR